MRETVLGHALSLLLFFLLAAFARAEQPPPSPKFCTYNIWQWSTRTNSTVNHRTVRKRYSQLTADERHASGCTVCEEEQVELVLSEKLKVKVCRKFAEPLRAALAEALNEGFELTRLVGYRPSKTLGLPDAQGLLNGFSSHSYGTAIDLNSHQNGLYNSCVRFGPRCRLSHGGRYVPGAAGSITREGSVYSRLRALGWQWGGDWKGAQKDFMHFSVDGR